MRRNTIQKTAIIESLELLGHATVEQIIYNVHLKYPTISIGTIYRNLQVLEDECRIKRIKIDKQADMFETVKEDHLHFTCSVCNNVIDIKTSKVIDKTKLPKNVEGHQIDDYVINLFGVCENCASKLKKGSK